MNNPITVYCDKDLVFKYVKEMPKEPKINCLFNSVCCSPFPCVKDKYQSALQKAKDEAIEFEEQGWLRIRVKAAGNLNLKPDTFYTIPGEVEIVERSRYEHVYLGSARRIVEQVARLKESKKEEQDIDFYEKIEKSKEEKQVKSLPEHIPFDAGWEGAKNYFSEIIDRGKQAEAELNLVKATLFVNYSGSREGTLNIVSKEDSPNEMLMKVLNHLQGQFKESLPVQEESKEDTKRLNWLQEVMTNDSKFIEVYFAGLRNFKDGKANSFQIESGPWEAFQSISGNTIREAIDKAMKIYNP